MNIGDTVMYSSPSLTIPVKILDLFNTEDGYYAEVEPVEFKSISREVPVTTLTNIVNEL